MINSMVSQPPTASSVDEFMRIIRLLSDPDAISAMLADLRAATSARWSIFWRGTA